MSINEYDELEFELIELESDLNQNVDSDLEKMLYDTCTRVEAFSTNTAIRLSDILPTEVYEWYFARKVVNRLKFRDARKEALSKLTAEEMKLLGISW